jgi:hypothetical protein
MKIKITEEWELGELPVLGKSFWNSEDQLYLYHHRRANLRSHL